MGDGLLLRAAGWWVTLMWRRKASELHRGLIPRITQLDGPPKWWPNLVVFDEATKVWEERYSYGLAALSTPRWLQQSSPGSSYGTMDLAQELLTRLLEQPNVSS